MGRSVERGRIARAIGAWGSALAVITATASARAYCQTTVCSGGVAGQRCLPAQTGDCGTPLVWKRGCIGYSIFEGASNQIPYDAIEQVLADAFDAWSSVDCGGAGPGVAAFDLGPVSCDQREYNLDAGNANIVFFHDDEWPYEGSSNTLALTTVTFNLDDGAIYDADLEINATVNLVTEPTDAQIDLASIVTHETGHMLGLAHSAATLATMFPQYSAGDTSLRTLEADDASALCASYPPKDVSECDPTPRRGLATTCDPAPTEGDEGCSCRTAPTPASRGTLAWVVGAGAFLAFARRRSGR